MKDQASDKLGRLASSFSGASTKADRLSGATDRLGNRLGGISSPASRANNSFNQLNSQWTQSLSLGNLLTRVLGPVALGAALTFGASKASALARESEQVNIAFEVMMGSATKAHAMVGEITQLANVTPFTRTELLDSAKLMLNFGIANEKILPNLKMIGDISGGNAVKMHLMTLAFSQSSAAGRLMGQDLLQMINAGFNPLQEISKKTGLSMARLKELMEKGAISTDMVQKAFKDATSEGGRFFGMMDKQSQTFEGRISTLKDNLEIFGTSIGNFFNKAISPFVDKAIDALARLNDETGKKFGDAGTEKDAFKNLQVNIRPLIEQYEKLIAVRQRSLEQEKQLQSLTQKIGGAIPLSVSKYDSEGNAKQINLIDAENYIRTRESQFLNQNKNAESLLEAQLKEVQKKRDFANYGLKRMDQLPGDDISVNNMKKSISEVLKKASEEETDLLSKLAKLRNDRVSAYLKDGKKVDNKNAYDPLLQASKTIDDKKLKGGIDSITGGGKQSVNVTINLQSLVAEQNFNTTTVKEALPDLERMVTEALLRVVNSANYAAAQ